MRCPLSMAFRFFDGVKPIEMINRQFDRLFCFERADNRLQAGGVTRRNYRCRCVCGRIVEVLGSQLRDGKTKSCGCLRQETTARQATRHGGHGSDLYKVWRGMRNRCMQSSDKRYHVYGGRGIQIEEPWLSSFVAFADWAVANGWRSGLTIERINVDGNYCAENCCFIPAELQAQNRQRTVWVNLPNGERVCAREAERCLGLSPNTIIQRKYIGWPEEFWTAPQGSTLKQLQTSTSKIYGQCF